MSTPGAPRKRAMSPTKAILLVAKREIDTRLKSKSFVWGTLGILAAIALYIGMMTFIGGREGNTSVALTGDMTTVSAELSASAEALGEELDIREASDPAAAEQQIRDGELDVLVGGTPAAPEVTVQTSLDGTVEVLLSGIAQQAALNTALTEGGLDPAQVQQDVAAAATLQIDNLEESDPLEAEQLFIGIATCFLLYMSMMMYGSYVATGVVEEKSSRVVELLLSTIRPYQLMLGKVLGIGLVGLVQLLTIAVIGVGGAVAAGLLTVPTAAFSAALSGLLWYLLGFFLLATLAAASGALVSRQEDVQSVISPMMMLVLIPFVLTFTLLVGDPENETAEWLSMVPFFSPFMMPVRAAASGVPIWQLGTAIVLSLAAAAALLWLGSRIYANAILRTGSRVKLKDAFGKG
ncbi:ABC transporter permease [Actinoalloteichus hymeniacidonis]|uniref:ABC-type Na+ efflux pump, permease component n=1 Tax=Actinoalloteichus hymeniacidonis TaxID=340345 RepID=A0AAC9HUI9_9PSEU|nr:ABC transporter permease [Actinoalloteichus hymeniacidonis]AOS65797.1 ABC-type Na+ efflux pump, permease component [Actinoalloteichus hymeniacidonis]MBB5906112.1 ABC-2 type transport system permease protein [Actinoalloteichus hymeniacidonis]